jgi:putative hydrolase of the HAD superfamily
MTIRGLIFDFDGLILDTETPEFEVWQEIYGVYGQSLPLNEWQAALGASFAAFDPVQYLSTKVNVPLDHGAIHTDHRLRALQLIHQKSAQPGIPETLAQARAAGLKLGIASSSPLRWVEPLLRQLNLYEYFDQIVCRDHVTKIKPDPELYLLCTTKLGLSGDEVMIFEDSPNGIRAANAAGIFCVALPNTLTRQLDISHADLILERIDAIPFVDLLLCPSRSARPA